MKISIKLFTIFLIIIISSCKKEKQNNVGTEEKIDFSKINTTGLLIKDNVFEMFQTFSTQNSDSEITSNKIKIDLTITSGAMISAYSLEKGDYSIYFRTKEKNIWGNWIEMSENPEVQNPNRKVFSPESLNNLVEEIQFKCNQTLNKEVIFRIFTFKY